MNRTEEVDSGCKSSHETRCSNGYHIEFKGAGLRRGSWSVDLCHSNTKGRLCKTQVAQ